jgi:hypothetical protein
MITLVFVSGALVGSACSDRISDGEEEQCYFVDVAEDFTPPLYLGWCEYEPGEVTPLTEEHCPAGECIDTFITCEEVPIDHTCQTCPAEDLDQKVLVALGATYEERCPGGPHELIDFERGCTYEKSIPGSDSTKRCCYTAIVVGECSLMGT